MVNFNSDLLKQDFTFNPSSIFQWNAADIGGGGIAPNTQPVAATDTPSFMDRLLGWEANDGTKHNGWGMPALGAANSLFQGWIGLEQLDLAKKSLSEQKRQFDMNWEAQKSSTNRQLADRQQRRLNLGDPTATDTASYMAKWGIK